AGIEADEKRTREYAESSPSIVTPLNRYIGYEEAAKVAKQALKERKTIRQVVLERGYVEQGKLTVEQLDAALDVLSMTGGVRARRWAGRHGRRADQRLHAPRTPAGRPARGGHPGVRGLPAHGADLLPVPGPDRPDRAGRGERRAVRRPQDHAAHLPQGSAAR